MKLFDLGPGGDPELALQNVPTGLELRQGGAKSAASEVEAHELAVHRFLKRIHGQQSECHLHAGFNLFGGTIVAQEFTECTDGLFAHERAFSRASSVSCISSRGRSDTSDRQSTTICLSSGGVSIGVRDTVVMPSLRSS